MVSFVRGEKFYVEPIIMQLHSDNGKNSRLGYKTLICKCKVVSKSRLGMLAMLLNVNSVTLSKKRNTMSFYSKVTHQKVIWVALLITNMTLKI